MNSDAKKGVAELSIKNDPSVTKVGDFIRRTLIDELPQLISIVKGGMSLIGLRPEKLELNISFSKKIKNYDLRLTIFPALSGLAQVNYSYGTSSRNTEQKFYYDLFYLKNYSLLIDILIFIRKIKMAINYKSSKTLS